MKEKLLSQANLERLISRLAEVGDARVPGREEAGDVAIMQWKAEKPLTLDYWNFLQSPKAFFFPQNQAILRFEDGKSEELAPPEREVFLFGVRPCDARALTVLDRVFLSGNCGDPYYAHLRQKTTVIALACTRTMSSCFCSSVGGGPGDGTGADVLAVELTEDLLLKAQTDKGERLLSFGADMLSEAGEAEVEESQERIRNAESQLVRVRTEDSIRRLRDAFDLPLWEAAGLKCLGCGTCSFLCPTCHCFDITDEVRRGVGQRTRTWDCCAYPLFTLQGSGHNPRPTARERWRQRVMHKFRYAVESFDTPFCVGCGRCIRSCPVALDIRTTLRELGA
jgi:ferredoxin